MNSHISSSSSSSSSSEREKIHHHHHSVLLHTSYKLDFLITTTSSSGGYLYLFCEKKKWCTIPRSRNCPIPSTRPAVSLYFLCERKREVRRRRRPILTSSTRLFNISDRTFCSGNTPFNPTRTSCWFIWLSTSPNAWRDFTKTKTKRRRRPPRNKVIIIVRKIWWQKGRSFSSR